MELGGKREQAQQKLTDGVERLIKAAGGLSTALSLVAAVAVAALTVAAVALVLVVRREAG
jgi:hypothetical protein